MVLHNRACESKRRKFETPNAKGGSAAVPLGAARRSQSFVGMANYRKGQHVWCVATTCSRVSFMRLHAIETVQEIRNPAALLGCHCQGLLTAVSTIHAFMHGKSGVKA